MNFSKKIMIFAVILLASVFMLYNAHAQTLSFGSSNSTVLYHASTYHGPLLSDTDKQTIINVAQNVPGLLAWSNGWQYVNMDYIGTNSSNTVTWKYAVVNLRLPTNHAAPFNCDHGWWATIKIDLLTKQAVYSHYPTIKNHDCNVVELGPVHTTDKSLAALPWFIPQSYAVTQKHSYATATEDGITANSLYGSAVQLVPPFYSSAIFTDMNPSSFVVLLLNTLLDRQCGMSPTCFIQVGWIIINEDCVACNLSANTEDLVFVDQSVYGDLQARNTGLSVTSGNTEGITINCGGANYTITVTYSPNQVFSHISNVPCSISQTTNNINNAVFFENQNTEPSVNWSKDVTSSVVANGAFRYDSSGNSSPWTSSSNVDNSFDFVDSGSLSLTGNLAVQGTATWSQLNRILPDSSECVIPSVGTWTISSSCTLTNSGSAPADVVVQGGTALIIPSGITLNINPNQKFSGNADASIFIEPGAKISH